MYDTPIQESSSRTGILSRNISARVDFHIKITARQQQTNMFRTLPSLPSIPIPLSSLCKPSTKVLNERTLPALWSPWSFQIWSGRSTGVVTNLMFWNFWNHWPWSQQGSTINIALSFWMAVGILSNMVISIFLECFCVWNYCPSELISVKQAIRALLLSEANFRQHCFTQQNWSKIGFLSFQLTHNINSILIYGNSVLLLA